MSIRRSETIREAEFDRRLIPYTRWMISGFLLSSVAGIPLIPLWLLWSIPYAPKGLARLAAQLTANSLEISRGVYNRTDVTIPLDRITDVSFHQNPLMRAFGLQGIRVETAGQAGSSASAEGNLVGIVDAEEFRDAILLQRELMTGARSATAPVSVADDTTLLTEIRDLLKSIDSKTSG